ncbi:PAS domain S-box protein [Lusitaniella coriacea LEGE 07157]|uniref:histidine kinase n=1 Tax=Lusitaniella coriacea LEGE 07157 TaxID=945747 RepID=A0A8J7DVL1_9CYAN|nr:PAS domain S-box protein [Lusitaniella coriacea]MBE9115823.1 PAS domain S-box protein [Lusitaniella coriacea LEGE 07157]
MTEPFVTLDRNVYQSLQRELQELRQQVADPKQQTEAAQRDSKQSLRTILDSVYDAIFIHDLNGTILDVNQKMLEMYGVSREEATGLSIQTDYSSPDNPLDRLPAIWQRVLDGESQLFEWKAKRPGDGSLFDVEVFLRCITLDGQDVILANVRDLRDRKQIERQWQESQQFLRLVIDNIPQLIFWKDRNSVYLGCNQNFAAVAGLDNSETISGKTDYDLPWTTEEADWYRQCDRGVMESGESQLHIIETQQQADGKQGWLDTNKIPLCDAEGNVVGILGTIEDITDRKKVEETLKQLNEELEARVEVRTAQLRENQAQLQRLSENIPGMIYTFRLNPDGTMSYPYVSSGVRAVFGLEPEQLHQDATLAFDRVHPEDIADLQRAIARSAQTLEAVENEFRLLLPSGEQKWVRVNSQPYSQPDGAILWYCSLLEISDRKAIEAALIESEAKYRRFVENANDLIWSFNLEGQLTYLSPQFQTLFGFEPSEFLGKPFIPLVHPDDLPRCEANLKQCLVTGERQGDVEFRHKCQDGSWRWVSSNVSPLKDENGNVIGFHGILKDIRDRKQAEEALAQSEAKFRRFVEDANDLIYSVTAEGIFTYLSPQIKAILGYEPSELLGQSIAHFTHPDDLPTAFAFNQRVFETVEKQEGLEVRVKHSDGSWRWISCNNSPIADAEGNCIAIQGIARDIRDRKAAEAQLREQEQFLRSIYDGAAKAIFVIEATKNKNFRYLGFNPVAEEFTGRANQQVEGKTPEEAFGREIGSALRQNYTRCLEAETAITYEDNNVFENDELWTLTTLAPLYDEQGKIYRLIGTAQDTTARKAAETQLQQKTQQLEQTLRELQRTQAQMLQNEKMSSLGQMVAGVAHEINNPINFIHGNLTHAGEYIQDLLELLDLYQHYYPDPPEELNCAIESLELEFLKEDLNKLLKSMRTGTDRIREIVLGLRNFARLDEAEFKAVNIHEGLDSTLMILQNRFRASENRPGIEVVKAYGNLPPIECYPGQLNQVFMNILLNAIDALEERDKKRTDREIEENPSQIRITTQVIVSRQMAKITISDNGPGIPKNLQNRIFDPFFTTKTVGQGTGLGLSISYQTVAEKHNGLLTCISSPGKGAQFTLQIPISQRTSLVIA